MLMDDKHKWVIFSRKKGSMETPNEKIRIEKAEIWLYKKTEMSQRQINNLLNVFWKFHALITPSQATSEHHIAYQN
jgi:hypothetical protein